MKTLPYKSLFKALHKPMVCFMLVCLLNIQVAQALSPGDLTSGNVNVSADGSTITLNSDSVASKWSNFVIGEGTSTSIVGGSAFLANVSGTAAVNGNLFASGVRVYIISPNGVQVGSNAYIQAADFVASGLEISDEDFLNGDLDTFTPFTVDNVEVIGTVTNEGTIEVTGTAALLGSEVLNKGTIVSEGGLILLATGDEIVLGSDSSDIVVNITLPSTSENTYNVTNDESGSITSEGGEIVLAAGDDFSQALNKYDAASFLKNSGQYSVYQKGTLNAGTSEDGSSFVGLSGANQVNTTDTSSTTADDVDIKALSAILKADLATTDDLTVRAYNSISAKGLESGGDMTLEAENYSITAGSNGDVTAGGTMTMDAGTNLVFYGDVESAEEMDLTAGNLVRSYGDITSGEGMTITAATTKAYGNLEAEQDLTVDSQLELGASSDQSVTSNQGTVTVTGDIEKTQSGELLITGGSDALAVDLQGTVNAADNIYIKGNGDIQLSGDISAIDVESAGGVSVISDSGAIYTEGANGSLDINIEGYSSYYSNSGVDLPEGEGKAAIVLKSSDTLTLGENGSLYAQGNYATVDEITGGVDDRAGADLLQDDATVIGDYERDEGDPMDIAIYAGSTSGNVNVNPDAVSVSNRSSYSSTEGEVDGHATVVFDAWDTVTFPDFDGSGDGGYRLEVVSRITEWLNEAIDNGRLPYADDPDYVAELLGDEYVLRGAGAEDNTRAWVLEELDETPGVAPLAALILPEMKGCPVEMDAAAAELAMNSDDLQLVIGNSLAANPNLQPCKACQKLVAAASILNDMDGVRMQAMNQIFTTMAPLDAPFTPEIQASVTTAFATIQTDSPEYEQYALAQEYIQAFVDYVAVLSDDLQAPVGDPVAFALEKHGNAITDNENPNIAAYIMDQLQASGQSI